MLHKVITKSEKETKKLAKKVASKLKKGDVIGFIGELGAGKTSFIQGLTEGLNVPSNYYVSSPTFTIMKIYKGDHDIFHFDFYRLTETEEFEELGFEDYTKDGISVIEWADRFIDLLPKELLTLTINVIGETKREILFSGELEKRMEDIL